MKTYPKPKGKRGAISVLMVLTAGTVALILSLYTYRQAIATHEVAASIHLSNDYREKEDAILRSMVAVLPNRAIRSMQDGAVSSYANWEPLLWQTIFDDSLDLANARTSISDDLKNSIGLPNLITANAGDSDFSNSDLAFTPVSSDTLYNSDYGTWLISAGINRELEGNFPPPLQVNDGWVSSLDRYFPLIADNKQYGNLAADEVGLDVTEYPNFNLIEYPQINFGYAEPGEDFVAKRHWWAFSMELARNDDSITGAARRQRDFVISIYEIPSQLAISASAFMSLGQFGNGEDWQNVTIGGGVFASSATVEGSTNLTALSTRRAMTLSSDASIGGKSFVENPFTPGLREEYHLTEGEFFPVSMASEGGRVAFVPISRGNEYYDRFAHSQESNTLSPTTWNNYSVGALQCAMNLDITECVSSTDPTPTELRFTFYRNGVKESLDIPLLTSGVTGLPAGYLFAANEDQTYNFGNSVVDVAFGAGGQFGYEAGATGLVTFNVARFGDPALGLAKAGYFRPSYPFEVRTLDTGKVCVVVYPQRFEDFLEAINADDTSINNSLSVNVDYTTATGSVNLDVPQIPCTDFDYGVILEESSDMTSFPRGFSLVTNMRLYFGDDFNTTPLVNPPAGYLPSTDYYPPVSIFAPEKRYGVEIDPFAVNVSGQIGSLAGEDGDAIRPLDSTAASGGAYSADRITINLDKIAHPADLPPITMKNWLVTVEEVLDN